MIEPNLKPIIQKGFAMSSRALIKGSFSALFIRTERDFSGSLAEMLPRDKSIFFYSTHSSWWDPVVAAELSVNQFKKRCIAPMDEKQFQSFKSLRFTGIFGVQRGDGEKIRQRIEQEFLKHSETALWVTPQGQFCPNELEQPPFYPGLWQWSSKARSIRIPVCIHYCFEGYTARPTIYVNIGEFVPGLDGQKEATDLEDLRQRLNQLTRNTLKLIWSEKPKDAKTRKHFKRLL